MITPYNKKKEQIKISSIKRVEEKRSDDKWMAENKKSSMALPLIKKSLFPTKKRNR